MQVPRWVVPSQHRSAHPGCYPLWKSNSPFPQVPRQLTRSAVAPQVDPRAYGLLGLRCIIGARAARCHSLFQKQLRQ